MSAAFPKPRTATWDSPKKIASGARLFWEPVKPIALMTKTEKARRLTAIANTWKHEEAA